MKSEQYEEALSAKKQISETPHNKIAATIETLNAHVAKIESENQRLHGKLVTRTKENHNLRQQVQQQNEANKRLNTENKELRVLLEQKGWQNRNQECANEIKYEPTRKLRPKKSQNQSKSELNDATSKNQASPNAISDCDVVRQNSQTKLQTNSDEKSLKVPINVDPSNEKESDSVDCTPLEDATNEELAFFIEQKYGGQKSTTAAVSAESGCGGGVSGESVCNKHPPPLDSPVYFDGYRVRRRSSIFSGKFEQTVETITLEGGDTDNAVSFGLGRKKTNRYNMMNETKLRALSVDSISEVEIQTNKPSSRRGSILMKPYRGDDDDCSIGSEGGSSVDKSNERHDVLTNGMLRVKAKRHKSLDEPFAFRQFFLLSKDFQPTSKMFNSDLVDTGKRFNDPFIFHNADCIDNYPSTEFVDRQLGEDALDPAEISTFCCPGGIKVRLVPRAGIHGANHLGWMGNRAEQFKVLVVSVWFQNWIRAMFFV